MTGVTKDRIADEAFETATFLVGHSLRIAHQHQLVRFAGTLERRMYIMIIVAHEPQPLVKSKAANGDFRLRRIDFSTMRPAFRQKASNTRLPICWHRAGRAKWPNARYRHIPEPTPPVIGKNFKSVSIDKTYFSIPPRRCSVPNPAEQHYRHRPRINDQWFR